VIQLKEQIEKHKTYCYDTEETDTDSSISSLGLDQFDGNEDSDSDLDSDNKTAQTKENSKSPTIPYQDYYTSSDTIMQIDTPPEKPGTNIATTDTSQSPPILSSLQTAAAAPLISPPVNTPCSNTDTWETLQYADFQET
jgi:hypothetical protein